MNQYYILTPNGWIHSTPLKRVINPILRTIQFYTNKPYVIASMTEFENDIPKFGGYVFKRVWYDKNC